MKRKIAAAFLMAAVMISAGILSGMAKEKETDILCGAYESYEEDGLPEEAKAAFEEAMKNYEGEENLTPEKLVATQVVAGTNYKILCDAEAENGEITEVEVTIYQDLAGNCTVTELTLAEETEEGVNTPLSVTAVIDGSSESRK